MANERQSDGIDGIARAARCEGGKNPPPVHLWNPPFCGDLDMRVATDGTWFYMKTPIGRPALVKLFASVLKRESGKYFLVTPVEKCGIQVDDAPFLAVEMTIEDGALGRVLKFRTNVDDWVPCGEGHALRFEPEPGTGGLKPYLHVRRDLWAKVTRTLFYDLVELGEERDVDGERMFGVASGGEFFAMAPADARIEGIRLMQPGVPLDEVKAPTHEFFARAKARLNLEVPAALDDLEAKAVRGDLDLDDALWVKVGVKATRPAAVLVPVVERAAPTVLLTQRTADLTTHSGQIAFPGGKIDPGDASPLAAALREANEEIGLERAAIEPIGYLDLYLTFSGFRVLPVVARVEPDYRVKINPSEVVEAFEVPLAFLMEPNNHQFLTRDWKGIQRRYYAMPFQERYIWGVTAGILRNLYERIYAG